MRRAFCVAAMALMACSSEVPAEPYEQAGIADSVASLAEPRFLDYEVVQSFPHDPTAFTQGLFIEDGQLYESTGRYEQSTLRLVDLETGDPIQVRGLPAQYFGEGATPVDDTIVVLTWRSGVGIVFDRESFTPLRSFTYPGEGWGLTGDGERLFLSDGSPVIRILDPRTFAQTGQINVTYAGSPLPRLNELEWIGGRIWANVWQTDRVVIIDPNTGRVTEQIDLTELHPAADRNNPFDDVLNGIAQNSETGQIYVTGKNWSKLFEIRVVDHQ